MEWLDQSSYAQDFSMRPGEICVITPCHSYIDCLPEALQSVRDQTMQPGLHLCVLDHVEEGGYAGLIAGYGAYTTVPDDWGFGVAAARNYGYFSVMEDYEWVINLDEDDRLRPDFIERMVKAQGLLPNVQVFYPDFVKFGGWIGYFRTPEYSFENLRRQPFVCASAMTHVKVWQTVRAANGAGFDLELEKRGLRWEDYLFWLEAGALGAEMARVGLALLEVRGPGQGSEIANRTQGQWRAYASEKLKRLYGVELETE